MLNCTRLCELRILVIVALALVTIQSWSQENRGGAILRSTARLVNVNLVVTDSQGQPVRDLTKDSFVVLDGGNQQKMGFICFLPQAAVPAWEHRLVDADLARMSVLCLRHGDDGCFFTYFLSRRSKKADDRRQ